jgi:hypothetical protein
MICSPLIRLAIFVVGVLAAGTAISAPEKQQTQSATFTPPAQFLVDKEAADLAAIVKVKRAENRWVILPDGDHFPLVVAEVEMEQVLSGSQAWPVGVIQTVVQYDYSDLIFDPIAPPVIEGRRYILFAFTTPKDGGVPPLAPWTAHPQGFLLVRGQKNAEFVFWSGKSYAVEAIREALVAARRLPLDQIVDPVRRLRVAEARMKNSNRDDQKAFIRGLLIGTIRGQRPMALL